MVYSCFPENLSPGRETEPAVETFCITLRMQHDFGIPFLARCRQQRLKDITPQVCTA